MANRYWNPRPKQRKASEKSEFERAFDKRAAKRIMSVASDLKAQQPDRLKPR